RAAWSRRAPRWPRSSRRCAIPSVRPCPQESSAATARAVELARRTGPRRVMAREIVLDTETTGFEPSMGHRMVEIACLEIDDFVPTGRSFHTYIDPCRDMPPDAERVHGLSA